MLNNASNYGISPAEPGDLKLKRVMLISLITCLAVSAFVGILFVVLGDFGLVQLRILSTTTAAGWFSLVGLCGAIWFDRNKHLELSYATMGAAGLAFLYSVFLIWTDLDGFDYVRGAIALNILAVTLAHASLMMLSYGYDRNVDAAAAGTMACSGIVAAAAIFFVLTENGPDEIFLRILGAILILGVLGTIVTPLIKKAVLLQKPAF